MKNVTTRQWWESAIGLHGQMLWVGVAGAVAATITGIAAFILV